MTHYPAHVRTAFLDWIEAGCIENPVVERNYMPVNVSGRDIARWMITCTDVLPKAHARRVAFLLGYGDDDNDPAVVGMTYATAASALLLAASGDWDGARSFLDKARPRRQFGTSAEDWWDRIDERTRARFLEAAADRTAIPDDLARMLADAGVIVVWAGFESQPWRATWPREILALLSLKRLELAIA